MEEPSTNLKNLSTEILYKIFRLVAGGNKFNTTRNFALVCKAWVDPAQSVLYSNVTINTLPQLQKFHNTVKHASHLGKKVKTFNLKIKSALSIMPTRDVVNLEIHELLTKLLCKCLPNLEELNEQTLQSYLPMIDAFQDSQLKHLQRLNPPRHSFTEVELANYATCAVFMKDRIEQLRIIEKEDQHGDVKIDTFLYANRLYRKLNDFTKLTNLYLERKTDDEIQVVEYVLSVCKSLTSLSFKFDPTDDDATFSLQSNNDSTVDLSTIMPSLNIYDLRCIIAIPRGYRNLVYIMHKFLNLNCFILEMKFPNPVILDHHIFIQLLRYSDGIKVFQAYDLRVDKDTISETMKEYWDVTKGRGKWDVNILITDFDDTEEEKCLINIRHCATYSKFDLKYSPSGMNQHYIDFIEEIGIYIKRLAFETSISRFSNNYELPNYFILHAITHCPHLKVLRIVACTFTQSTPMSIDLGRKVSLDRLDLEHCNLNEDTLRQASPYLHKLGKLRISEWFNIYRLDSIEISMGHTKIDCIMLQDLTKLSSALYLKHFAVDQKKYYYYCFDKKIYACSEQEYMKKNHSVLINVCCQNTPYFYIKA